MCFLYYASSVPLIPPVIIEAYNTSSTSIKVEWNAMPNNSVPGILKGYIVNITHESSHYNFQTFCTNKTVLKMEIKELRKYANYKVSIAAFTVKGVGPYSNSVSVTTDEDSKFISTLLITERGGETCSIISL